SGAGCLFTPQIKLTIFISCQQVHGKFPHCQFYWEMQRARRDCQIQLQRETSAHTGCRGEWDNVSCWQSAAVGEVTTLPCPSPLLHLFGKKGNLSRTCTEAGWSEVVPAITVACWSDNTDQPSELLFYRVVKILSTLGHSLSLVTLLTSTFIMCFFRRLHCTRNYIHLNLFVSFMLRAVAVLAKDTLLFSDDETTDCSTQPSLVGCKAILVFFNYFVMANFFWLLVEGLYLHTLLLIIRNASIRLPVYMLIGWGRPLTPAFACSHINFIFFISIIRILVQKLQCADVGGNEQSQFRRLAKSTLLLIPLFGINYVVFVYMMEPSDTNLNYVKIFFELGLGSFQGLIVAVLYCFLNSEVQSELRRMGRSLSLKRYVGRDYKLHAASASPNGGESSAQFPRSFRAPSILQTETSML
uniref:Vasoactive intestinal peptide receptor 2 n=1 Tax=Takifugu rubripes TaxID=31033 RepID=A0A674ML48_TAKRU